MSHTFWNAQSVTADEQCCASLLTIGDLSFNYCVRNSREIKKMHLYAKKPNDISGILGILSKYYS